MRKQIAVLVILGCLGVLTQEARAQATDSIATSDTLKNKYLPTGLRVGVDLISLAKTRFQNNYNGWDIQGDIDFNRYLLVGEYGHWGRNLGSDSSLYANSGTYWRLGVDVNFLTKDPDRNVFFIGARYGRSSFTESMSVIRYDVIWGTLSDDFYHSGVKASWLELTAGLKVKIWKILWLGYTARLKLGLSTAGSLEMLPYDVPGFGNTNKNTTWGFNYYVMVRLPLRKTPVIPPKNKH